MSLITHSTVTIYINIHVCRLEKGWRGYSRVQESHWSLLEAEAESRYR